MYGAILISGLHFDTSNMEATLQLDEEDNCDTIAGRCLVHMQKWAYKWRMNEVFNVQPKPSFSPDNMKSKVPLFSSHHTIFRNKCRWSVIPMVNCENTINYHDALLGSISHHDMGKLAV